MSHPRNSKPARRWVLVYARIGPERSQLPFGSALLLIGQIAPQNLEYCRPAAHSGRHGIHISLVLARGFLDYRHRVSILSASDRGAHRRPAQAFRTLSVDIIA